MLLVGLAHSGDICVVHVVPCTIVVVVEHHIMGITISEEIIPISRSLETAVAEDKLEMRNFGAHHVTNVTIEDLESPLVSGCLGLVHGFDSPNSWMVAPLID